MAAPQLPSPITIPTVRGRDDRSILEQLLVSFASQAPSLALGLLNRSDQQQAVEREEEAEAEVEAEEATTRAGEARTALGTMQGLQTEFAEDPEMLGILQAMMGPAISGLGQAGLPAGTAVETLIQTAPAVEQFSSNVLAREGQRVGIEAQEESLSFDRETRDDRLEQVQLDTEFGGLRNRNLELQMQLARAQDRREAERLRMEQERLKAETVERGQRIGLVTEELIGSRLEQALTVAGPDIDPELAQDIALTLRQGRTAESVMQHFDDYMQGNLSREEFNDAVFGDSFEALGTTLGLEPQDMQEIRRFFESSDPGTTNEWMGDKLEEIDHAASLGILDGPEGTTQEERADIAKMQAITLLNTWRSARGEKLVKRPDFVVQDFERLWGLTIGDIRLMPGLGAVRQGGGENQLSDPALQSLREEHPELFNETRPTTGEEALSLTEGLDAIIRKAFESDIRTSEEIQEFRERPGTITPEEVAGAVRNFSLPDPTDLSAMNGGMQEILQRLMPVSVDLNRGSGGGF